MAAVMARSGRTNPRASGMANALSAPINAAVQIAAMRTRE